MELELLQEQDAVRFRGLRATRIRTWRYVVRVELRWLVTLGLSIAIWQLLRFYSVDLVIMQDGAKRDFNVWITGLTIALGLAIANSLGKMAKDMRWWILSRRYRSRRKVEAILQAENPLVILRIALRSRRLTFHITAISWASLLLAAQIGLATLGFFYSVGISDKLALVVFPGNVSISNMSGILPMELVLSGSTLTSTEDYTANIYGALSLIYSTGLLGSEPMIGDLRLASDPVIFCDDTSCDVSFLETSVPTDPEMELADFSSWQPLVVATNRKIGITTTCDSYRVTSGGNGNATEIVYNLNTTESTKIQDSVPLSVPRVPAGVTVFMTDTSVTCGAGCRTVTALETSPDNPWFYSCNTTIGSVANATIPEHQVAEHVRRVAAQAIALRGTPISSSSPTNETANKQHQAYPSQSPFGTPLLGVPTDMAVTMSRFAAGVIAMVADTNTPLVVPGFPPRQASALTVDRWDCVGFILGAAVCVQLVLGLVLAGVATRVVIPPEGAVPLAKVLRAMAAADERGKEVGMEWIYRSQKVSTDGLYDLYLDGRSRGQQQESGES